MTLLETLPGVHRWCCTWCGREADRDEPCCEERKTCPDCGLEHPGADCQQPDLFEGAS